MTLPLICWAKVPSDGPVNAHLTLRPLVGSLSRERLRTEGGHRWHFPLCAVVVGLLKRRVLRCSDGGAEFRCRSLSPLRGRAGETGEVVQGAQFPRAACVFQFVCSAMLRATALKASSILSAHFMPGAVSMPLLRSRPSG